MPHDQVKYAITGREHKNWRALCNAALEARDLDELMRIVQDLNRVLKHEEDVRREFREAMRPNHASGDRSHLPAAGPENSSTTVTPLEAGRERQPE
jgi:hypothetical protein